MLSTRDMPDTCRRTITDKHLAQTIIDTAHRRLHEALDLHRHAVTNYSCSEGHDLAVYRLWGPTGGAQVHVDSDGEHRIFFVTGDVDIPAFHVVAEPDGTVEIGYAGPRRSTPNLLDQLALFETYSVALPELVPYGWYGNKGVVEGLLVATDDAPLMNGDCLSYYGAHIECNVLVGARLPDWLFKTPGDSVADDQDWTSRVWRAIADGRLVSLYGVVSQLERGLFAVNSNNGYGDYVVATEPPFAPNRPYIMWHPNERYPGERGNWREVRYRNTLHDWFWPAPGEFVESDEDEAELAVSA